MNKKYIVKLDGEMRKYANEVLNSKKTCKTYRKRANILLMLDNGMKQAEVARICTVTEATVSNTARDYCEKGIEYALNYKKPSEPQKKPIITGEKEARIIALACGEPPKGFSRWTIRLLTKKIIELSIISSVCPETVRSTLKKHNLSLI